MGRSLASLPLLALLISAQPLSAAPPAEALPLSEIIRMLEDSEKVAYFDEVEWDSDGYWQIEYYRPDGAEVEIKVDPVSGQRIR